MEGAFINSLEREQQPARTSQQLAHMGNMHGLTKKYD
jgi:hypothetical protein